MSAWEAEGERIDKILAKAKSRQSETHEMQSRREARQAKKLLGEQRARERLQEQAEGEYQAEMNERIRTIGQQIKDENRQRDWARCEGTATSVRVKIYGTPKAWG